MTGSGNIQEHALLRSAGFRDGDALSLHSLTRDIPESREVSLIWLNGTVLTALTGGLLMAAALFVSFDGKDTFTTPYTLLQGESTATSSIHSASTKTDRVRTIAATRSEKELVEASIREDVNGVAKIRRQPFERINATLATSATELSRDIPVYDPVALLQRNQPVSRSRDNAAVNTDIYSASVGDEIAIIQSSLSFFETPPPGIDDTAASGYVKTTVEGAYTGFDASIPDSVQIPDANVTPTDIGDNGFKSTVQNISVIPRTNLDGKDIYTRVERILTVKKPTPMSEILLKNGFTEAMVMSIENAIRHVYQSTILAKGARLRILLGNEPGSETRIPYRMSVYTNDRQHLATVARTDKGNYVIGLAPPDIDFPDEDTEEVDVANLPTIYRSIFETGRKHDLDDQVIERIISMFAYDLDLTKKVSVGDSIELLFSLPDSDRQTELIHVGLKLAGSERHMYRYQTDDGVVDFYDENGQTGKKFLIRRPLKGSGRLRSKYGYRVHPIFKTNRLHSGIDLAAPTGTPIYAAGDGVIKRARWVSGYGRYVSITHPNGYETAYAHMNRIASDMKPGVPVRQGQIIGYVGSTGYSTGPHLHYEIKINGRTVDPLKVRLPRDEALPDIYRAKFERTIDQIKELMTRDPAPITVAGAGNNNRSG